MRVIRNTKEAKETVLRPFRLTTPSLTQSVQEGIKRLFGKALTAEEVVRLILDDVRQKGDAALRYYTRHLDGVEVQEFEVGAAEMESAISKLPADLVEALEVAAHRVQAFHRRELAQGWMDDKEGIGQLLRPLQRAGVYVPGGRAAYPSTVLMTAIPAKVAGVKEVVMCTPPARNGEVSALVLAAAHLSGVDRVFKIGGAQAIGAMAYGTETVPRVDKVCGPGNIFVTLAKRMVYGDVGIDGLQGPTETLLVADEGADPTFCALDLLAQAEHDPLASAILITTSDSLAREVLREVEKRVEGLSESDALRLALANQGAIILTRDLEEALELANYYAPEHLCLLVKEPWTWLDKVTNAGGVFLGEFSPEVMGDYVAGPSHAMPTGGTARFSSALSTKDFLKSLSVVGLKPEDMLRLGPSAVIIARAEGLDAHAQAVQGRLDALAQKPRKSRFHRDKAGD